MILKILVLILVLILIFKIQIPKKQNFINVKTRNKKIHLNDQNYFNKNCLNFVDKQHTTENNLFPFDYDVYQENTQFYFC